MHYFIELLRDFCFRGLPSPSRGQCKVLYFPRRCPSMMIVSYWIPVNWKYVQLSPCLMYTFNKILEDEWSKEYERDIRNTVNMSSSKNETKIPVLSRIRR
jgi:hypothetical protein